MIRQNDLQTGMIVCFEKFNGGLSKPQMVVSVSDGIVELMPVDDYNTYFRPVERIRGLLLTRKLLRRQGFRQSFENNTDIFELHLTSSNWIGIQFEHGHEYCRRVMLFGGTCMLDDISSEEPLCLHDIQRMLFANRMYHQFYDDAHAA